MAESDRWLGMTVLVTGGTGYMGKLLIRKLLDYGVEYVISYSRRWDASEKLARDINDSRLIVVNGDVRDKESVDDVMRRFHPDSIIHAAAYKSVPSAQENTREAITVNLQGTMNVVDSALQHGVEELCFISTDKACAGINAYGKAKSLAEEYVASVSVRKDFYRNTRFFSVRYGNVVGSTGSVFELYSKSDKYLITDANMTRYWFRESSAAEFVLDSFERAIGGEVFIPFLSASTMRDLVLAWQDVMPKPTEIIGVRPGEKMHEQMISSDEIERAVWIPAWNVFSIIPSGYKRKWTVIPAFEKINESGSEFDDRNRSFSSYNTRRYSHPELVKMVKEYLENQ